MEGSKVPCQVLLLTIAEVHWIEEEKEGGEGEGEESVWQYIR